MDSSERKDLTLWPAPGPPSSLSFEIQPSSHPVGWNQLLAPAVFVVGYFAACKYSTFFSVNSAAPLWFPDSVLLCALLLTPTRRWVWYLLLGLPIRMTHFSVESPVWFLFVTYANDCLKGILSACVLRRCIPGSVRLNTIRQFGIYFAIAGLAAPALSAFAGAGTRVAMGFRFWPSFNQWFLGDVIAALVLTPTLLYWFSGEWRQIKAYAFQFAIFVLTLSIVLYLIFLVPRSTYSPVALYAPVPFLIVGATRFRPIGVSTAISLLALISIVSTVDGAGPFLTKYSSHDVLSTQLFLAVVSVPMLFVAILIEERRTVERQLNESRAILDEHCRRMEDLAGKLLHAQDHEREKIARELHDDIGQRVALLSISLDELQQSFSSEMEKESSLASSLLHDAQSLASDIHDLSHQLHSSTLRNMGLRVGLEGLCRSIARQHHMVVKLHSDDTSGISQEVELCLFRVAQEAINNAVRHGKAKHIEISLNVREKEVCMRVKDKGIGFDPAIVSNGLGLVSMRERLRFLGGQVFLKSEVGTGTEVTVELPVQQAA